MPIQNIEKVDPLVVNHFYLEISGETISQLSEVSGLNVELKVVDFQQQLPSGQYSQRKTVSRPQWTGELSVKRLAPLDSKKDKLWVWMMKIREHGMSVKSLSGERKHGSVVMYDTTLEVIAQWDFFDAWPSKIEQDALTVGSEEAISETVTFVYEKLERVK